MSSSLDKLVDDYGNACLKAGQSNSGLAMSYAWEHMQKLRKKLKEEIEKLDETSFRMEGLEE